MESKEMLAGRRIKLVRGVLSKSQETLAEELDVDVRTLRRWEAGELSNKGLEAVAMRVNLPAWYFYLPESEKEFEKRLFEGLQTREQSKINAPPPVPKMDESGLRQVHKIVYLIKARAADDPTPLLLTYFSRDWGMHLLPNFDLPEADTKDIAFAEHKLAVRLRLCVMDMTVTFDRNNPAMRSSKIKKTRDPIKAKKYGEYAHYHFRYATARLSNPPRRLLARYFKRGRRPFQWASLDYMESFPEIKAFNGDVMGFLKDRFGNGLTGMPWSFGKNIRA